MPAKPTRSQIAKVTMGAWRGVWDSDDRIVHPDYARYALGFVIRNGMAERQMGLETATIVASVPVVQGSFAFESGTTPFIFAVLSGQIYQQDPVTRVWTLVVTAANFVTAGITISAAASVYGIQFGSVFVLHDSTNRPFTWNGVAGAGGLVSLTNAPSRVFGQPAVYYGKVAFVKDVAAAGADRSTIVWSEENAANTGYEATGYNNAWTLTQMGSGTIYGLLGTNEALYYFRSQAIGKITGAMTTDFAAAGVHDSISRRVGTVFPRSLLWHEGYVWFVTAAGWPHRFTPGSEPEDLSPPLERFRRDSNSLRATPYWSAQADMAMVPIREYAAVMFVVPRQNSFTNWLFAVGSGDYIGTYNLTSASQTLRAVVASPLSATTSTDPWVTAIAENSTDMQGVTFPRLTDRYRSSVDLQCDFQPGALATGRGDDRLRLLDARWELEIGPSGTITTQTVSMVINVGAASIADQTVAVAAVRTLTSVRWGLGPDRESWLLRPQLRILTINSANAPGLICTGAAFEVVPSPARSLGVATGIL